VEADLLYFAAGRLPDHPSIERVSEEQVLAAFRALRRELKKNQERREARHLAP
jgi:hypothetical protein